MGLHQGVELLTAQTWERKNGKATLWNGDRRGIRWVLYVFLYGFIWLHMALSGCICLFYMAWYWDSWDRISWPSPWNGNGKSPAWSSHDQMVLDREPSILCLVGQCYSHIAPMISAVKGIQIRFGHLNPKTGDRICGYSHGRSPMCWWFCQKPAFCWGIFHMLWGNSQICKDLSQIFQWLSQMFAIFDATGVLRLTRPRPKTEEANGANVSSWSKMAQLWMIYLQKRGDCPWLKSTHGLRIHRKMVLSQWSILLSICNYPWKPCRILLFQHGLK